MNVTYEVFRAELIAKAAKRAREVARTLERGYVPMLRHETETHPDLGAEQNAQINADVLEIRAAAYAEAMAERVAQLRAEADDLETTISSER